MADREEPKEPVWTSCLADTFGSERTGSLKPPTVVGLFLVTAGVSTETGESVPTRTGIGGTAITGITICGVAWDGRISDTRGASIRSLGSGTDSLTGGRNRRLDTGGAGKLTRVRAASRFDSRAKGGTRRTTLAVFLVGTCGATTALPVTAIRITAACNARLVRNGDRRRLVLFLKFGLSNSENCTIDSWRQEFIGSTACPVAFARAGFWLKQTIVGEKPKNQRPRANPGNMSFRLMFADYQNKKSQPVRACAQTS